MLNDGEMRAYRMENGGGRFNIFGFNFELITKIFNKIENDQRMNE